ncbi:MAG: SMP-30/gluconolactonase/LRE family protein [Bryobacteraceae bacterium]|jgi:sugar lactone lactonase YvrE
MIPETILDNLVFPECPRWHDGALYFSDMHDGIVWRLAPDGSAEKVLEVPALPAGLGWLQDGALLVVSMLDRRVLRLTSQGPVTFADLSGIAAHPANDMVIDREGRAYVGNFGFDLNGGESPRATVLLRVDPDGQVHVAADEMMFPNGAVITPDGGTLVVAETFANRLTAFDIAPDGALAHRRVFARLDRLMPDGICLDAEGCIWVASPGANKVLRVRPGGEIATEIPLPGRDSFACMLGGAGGRDLFICTARDYLPARTREQRAGRIEKVTVDVPGAGLP